MRPADGAWWVGFHGIAVGWQWESDRCRVRSEVLLVAAGVVGVVAVVGAVGLRTPPQNAVVVTSAATAMNPYRRSRFLLRIHAVSVLLVVPQFALSIFGLVWLIADLGCPVVTAGIIVAAAQILGAVGRIGVGVMSDRT